MPIGSGLKSAVKTSFVQPTSCEHLDKFLKHKLLLASFILFSIHKFTHSFIQALGFSGNTGV